ncbi:MAG: formimidoylglutamate deiminase [Pseudomonadota bacterium]|nr:formimidoylglutamate deiminase [Pseudomonadota bacterium]
MKTLLAPAALLDDGWETDVTLAIDDDGRIASVEAHAGHAPDERLKGPVIPAMPNVHSHAFQRAIAGRTGTPSPKHDDTFWTWREAMWTAIDRLDADAFEAIAAQAYVEMAKAGYASVGEFHYVHHDPHGKPYGDPAELAWRIVGAAETAEIGLTLLPVFYAHGNFGGIATAPLQRRFVHSIYTFEKLFDALVRGAKARDYVLGVAPHSLRAVTPEELSKIVRLPAADAPIHIHAAEQAREVDDCYQWSGMRPVEWLLTQASIDERWCIVHATHMTDREVTGLAASGAVAGLAPSTEADLGDGIFPAESYLQAGGRFGVGTDSNAMIDPFAEIRQLEWSQRLRLRRRNVLIDDSRAPVGQSLWRAAAKGGAQALARPAGRLAPGMRADLIVLDGDDPALAEQPVECVLDAAIFGPCRRPVRDVMSRGRWIVRDGHHAREQDVLRRFRAALARIKLSSPP